MGDRGNIIVRNEGQPDLFLYTHWKGSMLAGIVASALNRKQRWDDPQYIARILFDELEDGDSGETGYGISTFIGDGDDQCVIVNCSKQQVELGADTVYPFDRYILLTPESLDSLTLAVYASEAQA